MFAAQILEQNGFLNILRPFIHCCQNPLLLELEGSYTHRHWKPTLQGKAGFWFVTVKCLRGFKVQTYSSQ